MSAGDLLGPIASALVCRYLLYALLRGERFSTAAGQKGPLRT